MSRLHSTLAALIVGLLGSHALAQPAHAPQAADTRFAGIDRLIEEAIKAKSTPGAVVLIGRDDTILFEKAYGQRAVVPTPEAMTTDTIFDMASLTKVVATTTAVMRLVEQG